MEKDQGEDWKRVTSEMNLFDSGGNYPTQVSGVIHLELSLEFDCW